MNHEIIAEIRDLSVVYHTEEDDVHALNGVSLKLYKGETLGLVGETGAGKTTTALSIMRPAAQARRRDHIRRRSILRGATCSNARKRICARSAARRSP